MEQNNKFINDLVVRSRAKGGRLALPEGEDPRVIEATKMLLETDALRSITLFGRLEEVKRALAAQKLQNDKISVVDTDDHGVRTATLAHFQAKAAEKGKAVPPGEAAELGHSPLNQAAYYLATGKVDAVVAGCAHTTADVIRASLKGVGLKPGIKTLSGSFVMVRGDEHYIFGDCGVVADPTAEQTADIAEATADTFKQLFPEEPKIAFLSFSTKGSAEHPRVEKMRAALSIYKKRHPESLADGELQFDAAFVPEVGARKAPGSKVAGQANCFIFPDLDSGNIGYKIAQRLGGFEAYGPILQGSLKPYLDLSRGANAKDIMVSSLLAVVRS